MTATVIAAISAGSAVVGTVVTVLTYLGVTVTHDDPSTPQSNPTKPERPVRRAIGLGIVVWLMLTLVGSGVALGLSRISYTSGGPSVAVSSTTRSTTTTTSPPPTTTPPKPVRRGTELLKYTNFTAYFDLLDWKAYAGDQPQPDGLVGVSIRNTVIAGYNGPQLALAPKGTTQANGYAQCRQVQGWKKSLDLARLPGAYLCILAPDDRIATVKVAQVPKRTNDYIASLFVTLWSDT